MPFVELLPTPEDDRQLKSYLLGNFRRITDALRLSANSDHSHDYAATDHTHPETDDWHYVGDPGEPAFTSPWGNNGGGYTEVAFRKLNSGLVVMKGLAFRTGGASTGAIFTLPAGYRPDATVWHSCVGYDGAYKPVRIGINNGGVISADVSTQYVGFEAITFFADA